MSEQRSKDQRANIHNPTSPEFRVANNNRANQLNSNNPAYRKSRGK